MYDLQYDMTSSSTNQNNNAKFVLDSNTVYSTSTSTEVKVLLVVFIVCWVLTRKANRALDACPHRKVFTRLVCIRAEGEKSMQEGCNAVILSEVLKLEAKQ